MSKNVLGAMPGNRIRYESDLGLQWGVVKTAGWQSSANGGKVWTYETTENQLVSATSVVEVDESYTGPARFVMSTEEKDFATLPEMRKEGLLLMLEDCDFPAFIKVAISCLVNYHRPRNLEVANFLIGAHISQLEELTLSRANATGINNNP